ncbi:MAG: hypothetical protein EOP46_14365 [Sphingobacteriaceae bacterium]|nr:MAG: hypothetical protein EOP46_14365 [Sphingobacteriaceae bacterium]
MTEIRLKLSLLLLALLHVAIMVNAQTSGNMHPFAKNRKLSPGKTSYFIDPKNGDDKNAGTTTNKPWRTFGRINSIMLSPGDEVNIKPGAFRQSLIVVAKGGKNSTVSINFAPGRYDIFPDSLYKQQLHISNTNDAPYQPKAIAFYINNSSNVNVNGNGARVVMRGKMIETFVNQSENIYLEGLSYDYHRPTVSELTATTVTATYADLEIHPQSTYSVKDSLLTWEGEGWRYQPDDYWQVFELAAGYVYRQGIKFNTLKIAETGTNKIRAYFTKNPGFTAGFTYQNRDVTRDCAGILLMQSKNISLKKMRIYFMHGMGVVSQFCRDITIDGLMVKPEEGSGKTCAAWADILHFSGCGGKIEVANSYLSAANDDAINVHGTHVRITEKLAENKLKVRFMHSQTYGFAPFNPGDTADFIRAESLRPFGSNVVTAIEKLNDKEFVLTLKNKVPDNIEENDVLENVTQTASVWVHHTTMTLVPTRGMLATTRRKVLVENNHFLRTMYTALLVEDDAESWFESGLVRDVTIRKNTFTDCGGPVISIHPENHIHDGFVHENINVSQNIFHLKNTKLLAAKSTRNITILQNQIKSASPVKMDDLTEFKDCTDIKISDNKIE